MVKWWGNIGPPGGDGLKMKRLYVAYGSNLNLRANELPTVLRQGLWKRECFMAAVTFKGGTWRCLFKPLNPATVKKTVLVWGNRA